MAKQKFGEKKNVIVWGLKDTPLIATAVTPGVNVCLLGLKTDLFFSVMNSTLESKELVEARLHTMFDANLHYCPDFIEFTLCAGNPVEHLPILYGKVGPYSQRSSVVFEDQPLFYEEITELEAYFVVRADEEQQCIIQAIRDKYGLALTHSIPLQFGLDIFIAIGKKLSVPTPFLDELRQWLTDFGFEGNGHYMPEIPLGTSDDYPSFHTF